VFSFWRHLRPLDYIYTFLILNIYTQQGCAKEERIKGIDKKNLLFKKKQKEF
jgi:hypothetical protein